MAAKRTIVDCHVHLRDRRQVSRLVEIADAAGFERANIVCTNGPDSVNANPAAFVAKAEHPKRFYVFAGLNHACTEKVSGTLKKRYRTPL